MRAYGALNPIDQIPLPPDTVGTVVISSAAAVVAQDWPTDAHLVLFSGNVDFYANFGSTAANIPSTNQVGATASSARNELNPGMRQVLPGSTGYSITGPSPGIITASFWRK